MRTLLCKMRHSKSASRLRTVSDGEGRQVWIESPRSLESSAVTSKVLLAGRQTDGHDAAENLACLIFGLPNVIAAFGSFSRGRS